MRFRYCMYGYVGCMNIYLHFLFPGGCTALGLSPNGNYSERSCVTPTVLFDITVLVPFSLSGECILPCRVPGADSSSLSVWDERVEEGRSSRGSSKAQLSRRKRGAFREKNAWVSGSVLGLAGITRPVKAPPCTPPKQGLASW